MPGRLFLIHWHAAEAEELAAGLRAAGWSVETEAEDGARAGQRIKANPPAAVLIYLTLLPSHGRATAAGLRGLKATKNLPIIFVDGKPEAVAKTKAAVPDALYTTSAELVTILARVAEAGI